MLKISKPITLNEVSQLSRKITLRAFCSTRYQFQHRHVSQERNLVKPFESRKTFLIDQYKQLYSESNIVLFLHRNNLTKSDLKYRHSIQESGGKLTFIRNNLFKVFLRAESHADPASKEAQRWIKASNNRHPLEALLKGPTAIVTIKDCRPDVVKKVIKILKAANEKLFIVGAKIDNNIYNSMELNQFKDLPTKEEMQGQLVGILTMLGGAGLVRTLEASPHHLYFTLGAYLDGLNSNSKNNSSGL
ncbi:54S ribosomal protein L11, mitochondrial [Komagataella phaffii CBS 7435]|uniref:Mitochondrial ribosomal protein of the large subunit n=2 Tax=Komagataella phaffii TaxID=460519 RepID=C4R6I1_KOMPG|nr:Mitochondrial ribosomal protein of the large subunit [Komagataella phaffii GS115]AOA64159.1 GQ67_04241T0 [Komagataella phaffii]CAH2448987.1 54S ribosomal protein L11, mitochondrial [Komagataella phaffii CBS 7435]AOA68827.1 GQ68_04213T0 [Komagataella phaffii GS115]CAY71167.1 Mitochondrial ribosomal protein of the large subunit [Komagataella phaffii GS115]CCA39033.1 54S ribosomal protein L11, mitochondrial [Komagataella phaffii CBS 7435]